MGYKSEAGKGPIPRPFGPGEREKYAREYIRLYGEKCDVCNGKGYLEDIDRHGKIIKTTCLICDKGRIKK